MEEYYKLEHKIDKLWREICCIKKDIANGMYFEYTYAEAEALRASDDLVPNALYLITDRGDGGIYMNALSPNTFDIQGVWVVNATTQDIIYYDFPNDVVYYREDKQNNRIWGEDNINNFYFNTPDITNNYISNDSDVKLMAGNHIPITFKNMSFINSTLTTSDELFSGFNENTSFKNTLISGNTIHVTSGKPTFLDNAFENCQIANNVFYQHGLIFEKNIFKNSLINQNTGVSLFGLSFKNNNCNYFEFTFNTLHNAGFDGFVYIHNNIVTADSSTSSTTSLNDFYTDGVSTSISISNNSLKNGSTINSNVLAVNSDRILYNTLENGGTINSNTSINKSGGSVDIKYNNVYYNGHINSNEECVITNNEVHYSINFNIGSIIYNNIVRGNITNNTGPITINDNTVDGNSSMNNNTATIMGVTIAGNALHSGSYINNNTDAYISNSVLTNTSGIASISGTINNCSVTNGSTISGGAGFIMTTCTLVCSSSIVTPGVYVNQFYNNVSI